jgi:hypothetical protein
VTTINHFQYEGEVRLICQEGGYADYTVELSDELRKEGEQVYGMNDVIPLLFSGESPKRLLSALMLEQLAHLDTDDRSGNIVFGRLRITVEQLEEPFVPAEPYRYEPGALDKERPVPASGDPSKTIPGGSE